MEVLAMNEENSLTPPEFKEDVIETISKEAQKKPENKFQKTLKYFLNRYFIIAMSGMALGLFGSLIVGVIIKQLDRIPFLGFLKINDLYNIIRGTLTGCAIGVGIAFKLQYKGMLLITAAVAGGIGYDGGPLTCFLAVIIACEIGNLIAGKTKIDLILTPLVVTLLSWISVLLLKRPILAFTNSLGTLINAGTQWNPFLMGMFLATLVGVILTSPLSSAAIMMSLPPDTNKLALGAACVGCAVNMIGFAVCSVKANGWSSLISIGIGTSMLQFQNALKKPAIWLPIILTSMILGPVSTVILKMPNTIEGAGMGTSGLVGQFAAIEAMGDSFDFPRFIQVILLHFILPATLVLAFNYLFKALHLIKDSDYLLAYK
jgi:uncharacterized membrane protein